MAVTGRSTRGQLLQQIQAVSFSLYDTMLYLDTHPKETEALARFRELNDQRTALMREFAEKYGALNTDFLTTNDGYTWVCGPWPWQEG